MTLSKEEVEAHIAKLMAVLLKADTDNLRRAAQHLLGFWLNILKDVNDEDRSPDLGAQDHDQLPAQARSPAHRA